MDLRDRAIWILIAAVNPTESTEEIRVRIEKMRQENANGFRIMREYASQTKAAKKSRKKTLANRKKWWPER